MDLSTRIINLVNFALMVALNEIIREAENVGKEPVALLEETIAQVAKNDAFAAGLIEKYKAETAAGN